MIAHNAEHVNKEAAGIVRWVRPEFQALEETSRNSIQTELAVAEASLSGAASRPKHVPSQSVLLRSALTRGPATAQDGARRLKGAPRGAKMPEIPATLAALGQARPLGGCFVACPGPPRPPIPRRPPRAVENKKRGVAGDARCVSPGQSSEFEGLHGGRCRARTYDPLIKSQLLYQLS